MNDSNQSQMPTDQGRLTSDKSEYSGQYALNIDLSGFFKNIRTISLKDENVINILLNIFFITSFFITTYASNIYVLFAIALSLIILLNSFNTNKQLKTNTLYYFIFAYFVFLSFTYYFMRDFRDSYRIIKTMTILLPILFIPPNINIRVSKLLHYFLVLNALLVCLDFLLYYATGLTITNSEFSGAFLRLGGLMEDSNFYSFTIVCYIQYLYLKNKTYNKLFVISIFLSASFSSILLLFSIFAYNYMTKYFDKKVALLSTIVSLSLFFIYYFSVVVFSDLRNYELDSYSLGIKLISLSMRFESQYQALMSSEYLFGIGAGNTMKLTDAGMNLHNSYLQIFLEMGLVLLVPVLLLIMVYYKKIDNKFIPLFMMILFLGNILEIIYFPLISFILFLSISIRNETFAAEKIE